MKKSPRAPHTAPRAIDLVELTRVSGGTESETEAEAAAKLTVKFRPTQIVPIKAGGSMD